MQTSKNISITIDQKDIEARELTSSSGQTIDALAYAAGQWDSNDLWENNIDYQPREPYNFNYEDDLLENTKTAEAFNRYGTTLCSPFMMISYRAEDLKGLQAGAYCALNDPDAWSKLLTAWTEKLHEEGTEGPSKEYNKELEKEIDDYQRDQYKEWLHGTYRRDEDGVIEAISKYFTEDREAGSYDEKIDAFTFTISPESAHELACGCYEEGCKDYTTTEEFKKWMLDSIASAGSARAAKDRAAREKRQAEYAKTKDYKDRVKQAEAEARKKKLEALKL